MTLARQTLAKVKRQVSKRFADANFDVPHLEARLLIEHATGFDKVALIAHSQSLVSVDAVERLEGFIARRLSGEPMDSILGYAEFYGRRFEISKDVLSPRPETEGVVELALAHIKTIDIPRVLDLGTGSGAILISIVAEHKTATGIGADVSSAALNIARKNARQLSVFERIDWAVSDWFSNITGKFDLIVSNPPYITNSAMNDLAPEVIDYDPDLALRGGEDGLTAYRAILAEAGTYLMPGGALIVEIGYDQGPDVTRLFAEADFGNVRLIQDLSGHDRIVSGIWP